MTRSEAIGHVIGYIQQIDSEWGCGGGDYSVEEEAIDVLTALGVTRDELVAHNLIREGYWYKRYLEIAAQLAENKPVSRIAYNVATSLSTWRPDEREIRKRISSRLGNRDYE